MLCVCHDLLAFSASLRARFLRVLKCPSRTTRSPSPGVVQHVLMVTRNSVRHLIYRFFYAYSVICCFLNAEAALFRRCPLWVPKNCVVTSTFASAGVTRTPFTFDPGYILRIVIFATFTEASSRALCKLVKVERVF